MEPRLRIKEINRKVRLCSRGSGGRNSVDVTDLSAVLSKYSYVVDSVVESYSRQCAGVVEREDLQSHAYLTFIEIFEEGFFSKEYSSSVSRVLLGRLERAMYQYYINEVAYHNTKSLRKDTDAYNLSGEVLMRGFVAREIQEVSKRVLSERMYKILYMYYWCGFTDEEIGKEFGICVSRASDLRHKAISRLRYPLRVREQLDYVEAFN